MIASHYINTREHPENENSISILAIIDMYVSGGVCYDAKFRANGFGGRRNPIFFLGTAGTEFQCEADVNGSRVLTLVVSILLVLETRVHS